MDMFKNYNITRLKSDVNEDCKFCKKKVKEVKLTKIFYTCPYNFILQICYSDESCFKLSIEEYINIKQFVERQDVSKFNYYLVGAIFLEDNKEEIEQYVSISRVDNGWIYYDGTTVKKCSFKDLLNHKHLKMLFYSTNNK